MWSKSAVVGALQKHNITRPRKSGQIKYGEKLVAGRKVPHLGEQKVIQSILKMRANHYSFQKIADTFNKKGIRNRSGGAWDKTVIGAIYKRERVFPRIYETKS